MRGKSLAMASRKPASKKAKGASRQAIVAGGAPRLPAGFARTERERVCIVTTEFDGLFKNGGIGTANTGLALSLAEAGVPVTVLYANISALPDNEVLAVQEHYRTRGVEIEWLRKTPLTPKPFKDPRTTSFAVYQFLRSQAFGTVYFQDNCGRGFYSLAAKRAGCFRDAPLMFVVAHGPHEWVFELNALRWGDKGSILNAYLERACAEYADAMISPSQYMVDWMRARDWRLPENVFVEHNIVRVEALAPETGRADLDPITEFVFFGRNELRKGLKLFCDAIDLVVDKIGAGKLDVTFLGKCSDVDGLHSGLYLLERASKWGTPARMLWRLGQSEAINYLSRPGVLAVMPSLAENSPCVVLECLQRGVPFIATDNGGAAELIAAEDAPNCLCAPDAESLAAKIVAAHERGHAAGRLRVEQSDTERSWRDFHGVGTARRAARSTRAASKVAVAPAPSVTICLAISDASERTEALIGSACVQSHPNCEVVVVRCGGLAAELFAAMRNAFDARSEVRWLSEGERDVAQGRNLCIEQAGGHYVLLVDEAHVVLAKTAAAVLVEAATRSAAVVASALSWKYDHEGAPEVDRGYELSNLPVGADAGLGLAENFYGECFALVETQALRELGGFPGLDDAKTAFWHFYAGVEVAGRRMCLAPEPLGWRREAVALPKSAALTHYRRLLTIFEARPLRSIHYLIENFVNPPHLDLTHAAALSRIVEPKLRDLAVRISRHDPNSKEAIDGFLQYCIERGRVEEALLYSLYNSVPGGAHIRWMTKDAMVEFDWPFATPWRLEAQLERVFAEQQIERVDAFQGEKPLKLEKSWKRDGRLRISLVGESGGLEAPTVRVRFRLPYVYHFIDTSREVGLSIERLAVRAADARGFAAERGLIESEALTRSPPAPPAVPSLASPSFAAPSRMSAFVDDKLVEAEQIRLDQVYRDADYKHLDLSLIDLRAGEENWREIKFKFCCAQEACYLEFRDRLDWPAAFEDFPAALRDNFGDLLRLRSDEIDKVGGWTSRRDQILLQAVLALLPVAIGTLESAGLSTEALWTWRTEAAAFSSTCLLALKKSGVGILRPE